jgi:hypothetical protein
MWPQNARHGLVVCHQHLISELKITYITAVVPRICITLHCVKQFLVQEGATHNTKHTCLLNYVCSQFAHPLYSEVHIDTFLAQAQGSAHIILQASLFTSYYLLTPWSTALLEKLTVYLYSYKFGGAHHVQCLLPGVLAISSALIAEHQVSET